jgi:flagellar L-ring protein precursor FlgH
MKFILILTAMFMLSGCASMKGWFGDNIVAEKLNLAPERPARYSDNPQMSVPSNREYRRMTKSRMEEEAELHSQAGSMWVSEGQSSYLFVQNKTRREGDILNIKLEGAALKQVETKVSVIKKLLKQLEDQQNAERQRRLAENGGTGGDRAPASEAPKKEEPKKEEKEDLSDLGSVPARIVEKLPDGNYRVKGAQPFMIGKREYKVIVTGLIRPEDYNDEGVSSAKLLDPQYDVVSVRRKQGNEQNQVL